MRFSWLHNLIHRRPSRAAMLRRNNHHSQAEFLEQRQVLTMLAPVSVAAGSTPTVIEVRDFNGDGINDIAALNSSVSAISVQLGNGDGTFQAAVNSAAGGFGTKMAVSDFDHDGKLDIITNQGSSIDLLKGNGDGSFQLPRAYYVGAYANDVEVADLNNDGFDDVATASFSYGGTTQVFINDGLGSFLPSRNVAIGPSGLDLESGDFDGDGNVDLVQSSGSGYLQVMMGRGDGTFASNGYITGVGTQDMQVADLNHDGKSDVIVTYAGTVKVFTGNGTATFQSSTAYQVGAGATRVQLADVNGDGNTDIVSNNGIAVLGRGDGGFYAPTNYGVATGAAIGLGDLNGDGGIDAVAGAPAGIGSGVNVTLNGNNDVQLLAGATRVVVSAVGSATAGSPFAVTVTAVDADGNIVTGFQGTVGISGAPGTQPVSYTFAAADGGVHTIADAATLFTAGTRSFLVTSPYLPDATGTIEVTAAAPAKFSLVVGQTSSVAGDATSVTVSTYDVYGNFASNYTGTIHFASSDVQAGLPSDYTFTAGDNGTHTFNVVLKTAGSQTVRANDINSSAFNGVSGAITVTPAAAASLSVTGGSGYIGSSNAVRITARDAYGNVATGDNGIVHLTSSDAASVTSADAALINGVGTFSVTPMTLGLQTLTATDASNTSVSGSEVINVTPGWGARFVATPLKGTVAGQMQTTTLTVYDSFGNVSTVYTGWVSVATSDPRAPLAYVYFTAADAGVKTIPVTLYTVGSQAVTISDYANPAVTVTQTGINVTPAAAASLSVTALQGTVAGVAQNFTVTVRDAYGNLATNYRGTLNFTSGDKLAALPAAYTFTAADAGAHTFSLTFKSASGQDLTVTDSLNPAITSYQRDIVITPAAMAGFNLRAQSNVTAGVAFNITVQAVDAYGNIITGYTGKIHFTGASGGGNLLPADYTFTAADAGVHVFSITFTSTGTQSIGVQDTVIGSLKGQTSVKVVTAPTSTGGGGSGGGGGGGGKKVI